jgi:hypothetical protein
MWQTIVTLILFLVAAIYVARHFLRVFRTGSDCSCSGCSSSGCCAAQSRQQTEPCAQEIRPHAPAGEDHRTLS